MAFRTGDHRPFIADMWTSFMAALGVDTRFSTPGHAQSDGASERVIHRACRHMLRALSRDANSLGLWKAMLPRAVCYNSTPHNAPRGVQRSTWQC